MRAKKLGHLGFLLIVLASPLNAELMEVVDIADGDTLNLRSGPGIEHADIGDLQEHEWVNVLGQDASGNWAQIRYRGSIAWVSMRHLSSGLRQNGAATTTGPHQVTGIGANDPDGGLVVRAGEGKGFASIGVLENGTTVHVIQNNRDNTWSMITFGPGVGWVRRSYLTSVSNQDTGQSTGQSTGQADQQQSSDLMAAPNDLPLPGVFRVKNVAADDVLNIRLAPNASAEVLHQLANGSTLVVLEMASAKWAKVSIGDAIGYAHMAYLTRGGGTTTMTGFQIDTECIGTEPFWRMTFDTDNMVRMTMMGEVAQAAPLTATTYAATPTGYPYSFEAAPYSGQVNMEICSDGMSDNIYPMSITLTAPNDNGAPMVAHGCCRLQ